MSQPLAPRLAEGDAGVGGGPSSTPLLQRPRKISTACAACKLRKTKCTGGQPCSACNVRNSECNYDATADQRRKIANRRNVEELNEAQSKLESHRRLLGGILATISKGNVEQINDLINTIRDEPNLSQLAAHVRNSLRSDAALARAYDEIIFEIDGPPELPSPARLLSEMMHQPFERAETADSGTSNGEPERWRQGL